MISSVYVIEQLCRMMGNSEGIYGIEWSLDSQLGYRAIVNGVGLYLLEDQGRDPRLYLFLFKDRAKVKIVEPVMHLSCAPIGKFLRQVTSSVGMDPWPKFPETSREEANERLRIEINKLYARVCEQDDLRRVNALLSQDLHAAIGSGMFRKNFFDPTEDEDNEGVSQQLFRELLRLKPAT